ICAAKSSIMREISTLKGMASCSALLIFVPAVPVLFSSRYPPEPRLGVAVVPHAPEGERMPHQGALYLDRCPHLSQVPQWSAVAQPTRGSDLIRRSPEPHLA